MKQKLAILVFFMTIICIAGLYKNPRSALKTFAIDHANLYLCVERIEHNSFRIYIKNSAEDTATDYFDVPGNKDLPGITIHYLQKTGKYVYLLDRWNDVKNIHCDKFYIIKCNFCDLSELFNDKSNYGWSDSSAFKFPHISFQAEPYMNGFDIYDNNDKHIGNARQCN